MTFLKGFVDVDLTSDKVLVTLHVGKDTALIDPVVVVGAKKEDREVSYVVAEALNVWRDQARITDFSRPPPKEIRIMGAFEKNLIIKHVTYTSLLRRVYYACFLCLISLQC